MITLYLADPGTMMLISMGATAIGSGVTAFGKYQAGQAQAAQYGYQADVNRKLAGIATTNAQWDIQAGEVKAQQAGLISRAAGGRILTRAGAGNIDPTTGSTAAVSRSQIAVGQENQAIQRADAAHAAYGEDVQAAEKTATAGADVVAGRTAVMAGDIGALGSIVSGVGSVAGKWYDVSQLGSGSAPTLYQDPNTPEHLRTSVGYS